MLIRVENLIWKTTNLLGRHHTLQSINFEKKLYNTFQRITLANVANRERVTIDNAIHFSNENEIKYFKNWLLLKLKIKKQYGICVNQVLKIVG